MKDLKLANVFVYYSKPERNATMLRHIGGVCPEYE
jgi:hypothetical protein